MRGREPGPNADLIHLMLLTLQEIEEIAGALRELDGQKQPDGTKKPYTLSASTRWNVAKNMRILKPHLESLTQTRDGLVAEISGGRQIIRQEETELMIAYGTRIKPIMAAQEEIAALNRLKLSDLNSDANGVPSTILAALTPLIDE